MSTFIRAIAFCALFAPLYGPLFAQGKMRIVVSVDWEGRNLDPENLAEFQKFRNDFPKIPLQLFLNAAYFTKEGAVAKDIVTSIRSVLRPAMSRDCIFMPGAA